MNIANNILETIGNTPLVKLNKITSDLPCTVLAKVETFNPGNSTKDRMALKMVEDAEADGRLKPGGTIVEGTSGNTGMGLALAAVVKGYKLICVITDKQSKEKVDVLKAVGAEVVVCPTDVAPDDPRSYYSVSKRLATETPNAWYVNQYDNPSNAKAHYEQTGPEIWRQTEGKVTHFIVGVGTGGTISGVAKYLKEQNPAIKIWGVDTYGSVFKKYHETGFFDDNQVYSYVTEGIGEDILPENVDFTLIDGFTKVTDKDAAVYTRKLAREEGIFVGNSAGSAIKGTLQLKDNFKPDDVVVVLFHDSGSRYIGKIFNDDWMRAKGYIETPMHTIADAMKEVGLPEAKVRTEELLSHAVDRMNATGLEILPVFDHKQLVGTLYSSSIWQTKITLPLDVTPVLTFMKEPLPVVDVDTSLTEIQRLFSNEVPAVFVKMSQDRLGILTPRWLMKVLT